MKEGSIRLRKVIRSWRTYAGFFVTPIAPSVASLVLPVAFGDISLRNLGETLIGDSSYTKDYLYAHTFFMLMLGYIITIIFVAPLYFLLVRYIQRLNLRYFFISGIAGGVLAFIISNLGGSYNVDLVDIQFILYGVIASIAFWLIVKPDLGKLSKENNFN